MPAPELSVVIASLDGEAGVDQVLRALAAQMDPPRLEIILVDDGSKDGTAAVGERHGVRVIRHPENRGLAAARNTGVRAARAPIVAFLDDDCEPAPNWARTIVEGYEPGVSGVGGTVVPVVEPGITGGFVARNNPLSALELDLARSYSAPYRLWLYLRRQWTWQGPEARRAVFSPVGANMSFRRETLVAAGLFDERFTTGDEEVELAVRVRERLGGRLVLEPAAVVRHHFPAGVGDMVRRARSYGRGSARSYRKWPRKGATVFPLPVVEAGLALSALRQPRLALVILALPQLVFPRGPRHALRRRAPAALLDPYLQLLCEAADNVGFVEGLWRYRRLEPEPADEPGYGRPPEGAVEAAT